MSADETDGFDIFYEAGTRNVKTYSLTETEMFLLAWLPWFARRRLIKRIREETVFGSSPPEAP